MNIRHTRRISQIFFFVLFCWFCLVATIGDRFWQLRGWPVNWFLQLDPLVGIGTLLTTRTLFAGLAWCVMTIVLTLLLGRFFCGWVCPFGSLHQLVGYLGRRRKNRREKIAANQYRRPQYLKYWILVFLLSAAAADALNLLSAAAIGSAAFVSALLVLLLSILLIALCGNHLAAARKTFLGFCGLAAAWIVLARLAGLNDMFAGSLQTGLLDPIPLLHRSVNLILLPAADRTMQLFATGSRYYEQSWIIGGIFLGAVFLNLLIPRFYCRFVCPLGALFGILSRNALWRIGQKPGKCTTCKICETDCEGACEPSGRIRTAECVLCMNCLHRCPDDLIEYSTALSAPGEIHSPDLARREIMVAAVSGLAAIPVLRLGGQPGPNWNPALIRPPGALDEVSFLSRCIKCGQCMRICPTNIIHPAGFTGGLEGVWTPRLNFRIGTSGCQLNCIACGQVCPTAAIRPILLEEKHGKGAFAEQGPIRIGTAFVDRGRCLPWAMKTPCIVCQENCPVSPKAIYTETVYEKMHMNAAIRVQSSSADTLTLQAEVLAPGRYATGDYAVRAASSVSGGYRRIVRNTKDVIQVEAQPAWNTPPAAGSVIHIYVRLQKPLVNPEACIGCGTCEHECPVSGKRAIRITAENETRNRSHTLLL